MKKPTMITGSEKAGFMTFSAASNIVFNFKSLYYLIFLTNVLKIPVGMAGTILTLGIIWDAINDPLIGIWCANHKFKSGEKVRPLALWFALPWAASTILLFCDFKTSETITVIIALAVYFVFEALNTFIAIPYNSMGSLATNLDGDRKSINAFRSLGGCLGSGIGSVAVTPLVKLFGGLQGEGAIIGAGDAKALFLTGCVMGVICIIGSLAHYFTTRERIRPQEEHEEKISLIAAYRMLFKCKSWVLNMLYIICYGIICALVMNNINYYAAYIMGSSSAATPILAAYLVVAILASIFTPMLDEKIGRKNCMLFGAVILILGKIPFIIDPYSIVSIYVNAVTVGIGATVTFVMFNTNRNNIADIVELQSGRRIDSMVGTGDNLASKLAEAGAVKIMTAALAASGFNEALQLNQPAAALSTINALLGWVPCVVSVLMLAVLLFMDVKGEMEKSRKAAGKTPEEN